MKVWCLLMPAIILFFQPAFCEAGGVAARQQSGVQVRRQVQIDSSSIDRPGVWPTPKPEIPATEETEKAPEPTPSPVSRVPSRVSQVLVSSPRGGQSSLVGQQGQLSDSSAITVEESLAQLLAILDQSSEMWLKIDDVNYKILVVSKYIDSYRQQKIIIRKPPDYYAQFITSMGQGNPALLSRPFADVLKFAAIMEYDFENGQDKDHLAQMVLGRDMYLVNRKRLGLP